MKKIELIISIFIFFMFIPFIVNAKTCDTDKISIESIKIEEKTDGVEENKEASFNDKDVNLNLSLTKEGDSIKYKIIVKNNSKDDYLLDQKDLNDNSEYIGYSLESDDNSNIIKAESQKSMYLNVKYKKRVPNEVYKLGKYNEDKTMAVNISTKNITNNENNNLLKNPNTKTISYLSILILMFSGLLLLTLRKRKVIKFMILLVSFSIIIPMSVGALCSAKLNINYNINVKYLDSLFCSGWETGDILIPYREGMTWQEFDDFIIDNYQDYNTYFYDRDGHLIKSGYLKKYGINENSKASRYDYEYAEHVLPVNDRYNPDILQDDFFSFGKIKQRHINYYNYSNPNIFAPIANLESKYPEFYNKVSVDPNWTLYNQNIFDEKYGCYWFDGS